ncbi:C40 family peptidase [Phycicoccus sp. 3266]|uniref:C40 family peptidase n=1 Tax=Phycicoccus sp. 3266 TaxID=2817751 RepID=UPI0028593BC9|nr:C40 family peptidase [Phycicoccus sp. 3266]MDR6863674.1 cell wall-associated NlpC family hydrolase [Phycicoccus sp. 3266]
MPGTTSPRRALRVGAAMSLVGALGLGTAWTASADPGPVYPSKSQVDKARAKVSSTAGQVAALDAKYAAASAQLSQVQDDASAAAEAYNGARLALDQATAEADAAAKRASAAQAQADAASLEVRRYASSVYQSGGNLGELDAYLSSTGPQDLVDRATAIEAVSDARSRALQKAAATSVVAQTMRAQAATARDQQAQAATSAQEARDAAQARADQATAEASRIQHEQQAMTVQLASLRKTSVAMEKQRQDGLAAAAAARAAAAAAAEQARLAAQRAQQARDAAARRAAQAAAQAAAREAARQKAAAEAAQKAAEQQASQPSRPSRPTPPAPQPADPPPPPPSSGGVGAVIAYAQAQLGKPYGWGAAGPSSFDCSGLTMMAWRQAGVYLSHYTGAQWAETSRVAISDLRPGDLVFYGSDGPSSHHMGLYVGNGQMIEAPHTGAVVRYASIYRSDLLPYGGRP